MKSILLTVIALFALSAQAQQLRQNSYSIGPGDTISISVYDEADLSFNIKIGDSGSITYPFIGVIRIAGTTISDVEEMISSQLISGEFLIRPEVTVAIQEYRPFYIDGQVNSPGGYPFEPGLTLRKAVSIAGGFTERASRSKISVISRAPQNSSTPAPADYLDTPIRPDDVITVEQRFF